MKKALLLAVAAAAMLLPSVPVSAEPASASGVVRAGYTPARHRRRSYRSPYRYWGSWGWGPWSYGWGPYSYGYYGYRHPYGYYPSPDWAAIDTDLSPEAAQLYLDGKFLGVADDFDGYPDFLYLKRGRYSLEFRLEGYDSRTIEIQARPGMKLRIDEELRKVPGARRYGSYEEPARPEGGVRRFWGKRRDATESVEDEEEIYGGRTDRCEPDREGYEEDKEAEDKEPEEPRRQEDRERREDWRGGRRGTGAAAEPGRKENTRLRLRVEPSDAAIYLDDRFVGTGEEVGSLDRGISVAPGKHTVTVSRPGFTAQTTEVEVEEGETKELELSLKR